MQNGISLFNRLNPWTCSPEYLATQMQYVWNAHDRGFIPANRSETEYLSIRDINFSANSVDLAAASHFYWTAPTYENLEPPREDPPAPAAAIGSAASESPVPLPRPPRAASTNARDGPPLAIALADGGYFVYLGMATFFLCRELGLLTYTATGCPLQVTQDIERTVRRLSLLPHNTLIRLNEASWQLQNVAFYLSAYTDLDPLLYGTHSFQLLLVLLFNRAQFSKPEIAFTRKIQKLTTRSPSTPTQLASLMLDFNGLQILKNITDTQAPFQCNELLLQQVADGIQRGIQLFSLSPRIQA